MRLDILFRCCSNDGDLDAKEYEVQMSMPTQLKYKLLEVIIHKANPCLQLTCNLADLTAWENPCDVQG